jgi:hypothetical protein
MEDEVKGGTEIVGCAKEEVDEENVGAEKKERTGNPGIVNEEVDEENVGAEVKEITGNPGIKEEVDEEKVGDIEIDDGTKLIQSGSCEEKTSKEGENVDTEINEYSYLQREGFTSELFKVKLTNLTRHACYSNLKKQILSKNLKPRKIKLFNDDDAGTGTYALITFADEKDRDDAIRVLDGHQWKGHIIAAKKAKPKADPFQMQRKRKGQAPGEHFSSIH